MTKKSYRSGISNNCYEVLDRDKRKNNRLPDQTTHPSSPGMTNLLRYISISLWLHSLMPTSIEICQLHIDINLHLELTRFPNHPSSYSITRTISQNKTLSERIEETGTSTQILLPLLRTVQVASVTVKPDSPVPTIVERRSEGKAVRKKIRRDSAFVLFFFWQNKRKRPEKGRP